MVDSLKYSTSISTLLRAQAANAATTVGSGQQAARTLINQQANGARPVTVQPAAKALSAAQDNLPRGSLVDILA